MRAVLSCATHPTRNAEFECTACRDYVCHDCARPVRAPGGNTFQCIRCDGLLRLIGAAGAAGVDDDAPEEGFTAYFRRLPTLLAYPLQQSVLYTVLGLALLNNLLYWASRWNLGFTSKLFGLSLATGLEVAMYFHVVHQTAFGEEHFEPPDFTNYWDDLFAPLGRYVLAASPILVAAAWFGSTELDSIVGGLAVFIVDPLRILTTAGPGALLVAGVALLPLLTAVAAVSKSFLDVMSPLVWLRLLRAFGSTYVAAALAFYSVLALELLVWGPVVHRIQDTLSIPVISSTIALAFTYLPLVLRGRLLGALCEPYTRNARP